MSVASRTPSGIGIITLRSTMAIDWSSFSVSMRRCLSAALSGPCWRAQQRARAGGRDERRQDQMAEGVLLHGQMIRPCHEAGSVRFFRLYGKIRPGPLWDAKVTLAAGDSSGAEPQTKEVDRDAVTIIAFNQHAATTVAAVVATLGNDRASPASGTGFGKEKDKRFLSSARRISEGGIGGFSRTDIDDRVRDVHSNPKRATLAGSARAVRGREEARCAASSDVADRFPLIENRV